MTREQFLRVHTALPSLKVDPCTAHIGLSLHSEKPLFDQFTMHVVIQLNVQCPRCSRCSKCAVSPLFEPATICDAFIVV